MDWKSIGGNRIFRIAGAATFIASVYLAQPYRMAVIMGNSMSPTYRNHEVELATTDLGSLKRGDVILVDGPSGVMVKRIAYLPGDWMEMRYLGDNWYPLATLEKFENVRRPDKVPMTYARVPDGYVYVLGDNPIVSVDSRTLGALPVAGIHAKLIDPKPKNESAPLPDIEL
jgi:signal peptidase I